MPLTDIQRRLRKSKQSERDGGHWLMLHDGPDPRMLFGVAATTGRVGHITALQYDVASKTYAMENKNVKLPAKIVQWWMQIIDVAAREGKEPLLRIEPSNVLVGPRKKAPEMHILTADRHADLLKKEKDYDDLAERYENVMNSLPIDYKDMFPDDQA